MVEFLIAVVPLALLVVALLLGRYPGCEAAMRIAERIAALVARQAPAQRRQPRPERPLQAAPMGGLLLAVSLSGRAPPA